LSPVCKLLIAWVTGILNIKEKEKVAEKENKDHETMK
jgi:hypothetical protein